MTIHIPTMTGGGIEVTTENLAKTRFVLSDGTVEEYDIVGPLDEQTMVNYGFYQRRANLYNEQNEQEFFTEITEKRIVEAYIGNTVTSIDYMCDQTNLTTIVIPSSVTEISGFSNCTSLTNITIPNSVTNIGNSAFQGCSGLTSMTMPNSVTNIGSNAFFGCSNLTSIVISDNTVTIGNSAFYGCSGLTSVTIPDSVTSIGQGAFSYCSGLTSLTIPNGVTRIGVQAFNCCDNLEDVTMADRTRAELETMDPPWTYWGLGFHSSGDTFAFTIHCEDEDINWEP